MVVVPEHDSLLHVPQILGGLALASVLGVLYMIRNRDVGQQGTPTELSYVMLPGLTLSKAGITVKDDVARK